VRPPLAVLRGAARGPPRRAGAVGVRRATPAAVPARPAQPPTRHGQQALAPVRPPGRGPSGQAPRRGAWPPRRRPPGNPADEPPCPSPAPAGTDLPVGAPPPLLRLGHPV